MNIFCNFESRGKRTVKNFPVYVFYSNNQFNQLLCLERIVYFFINLNSLNNVLNIRHSNLNSETIRDIRLEDKIFDN